MRAAGPLFEQRRPTMVTDDAMVTDDDWVRVGDIVLRPSEYQAFVSDCRVALTVREFEILAVLAAHPDRVLSRDQIYGRVWGGPMPRRDRSVDVFVRRVRRKLAQCAPAGTYIHTHFGVGYRLSPEPEDA